MIYTNSVIHALYTILSSDATLVNSNVLVEFYQIENSDPQSIPFWVNIVQPEIPITPWRSNVTAPWKAEFNIPIVTQVQDYADIALRWQAMRDLDNLNDNVWSAVNCNRTLNDTVNIITAWNISPFNRDDIESDDFLMSQLTLTAEVFA
jgi:hypothetical protein